MTTDITVFSFESRNVRMLNKDGEILFRASDIAAVLGMRAPDVVRNLDEDDVHKVHTLTDGGKQELSYLSESGVYTVLLRSNKPQAKPFRRWVTKEVLPSIRREGQYVTEQLKKELEERDAELARKEKVIQRLQKKKAPKRWLVPDSSQPHFEGFEPPLVSKPETEMSPEETKIAKREHVIKTMNGLVKKHILEVTAQEKADIICAFVRGFVE